MSAQRFYSLPGGVTVVRSGTGTNYVFEIESDQHGTNTLYLNYTCQDPTWRQYDPYGNARGSAQTWIDNQGFLGDPVDSTTALQNIGARWYDPAIGGFISLDPELETDDPTQLGGCDYSGNDPASACDPTGQFGIMSLLGIAEDAVDPVLIPVQWGASKLLENPSTTNPYLLGLAWGLGGGAFNPTISFNSSDPMTKMVEHDPHNTPGADITETYTWQEKIIVHTDPNYTPQYSDYDYTSGGNGGPTGGTYGGGGGYEDGNDPIVNGQPEGTVNDGVYNYNPSNNPTVSC